MVRSARGLLGLRWFRLPSSLVMPDTTVLRTLRTATSSNAFVRSAILLLLIVGGAFSQPSQPRSEEDRAGDLKKRVVETLHLRPGDTAADVGCGDGFYTIPLARFLGPSGKVYAEDIDDKALYKLKQNLIEEHLENVEVEKGLPDDPKLPIDTLKRRSHRKCLSRNDGA